MAIRTTSAKVSTILETELEAEHIDYFIEIASHMVDDVAAIGTLAATRLAEIERWLTGHLISITLERKPLEEEIGNDTRIKYSDIFGAGLQSTHYGQMVATLDTTGTLAALGKKKISIVAITSFE
jgi:hypothetical protein